MTSPHEAHTAASGTISAPSAPADPRSMARRYRAVRRLTESLAEPLAIEDQVIQSMPDVSPTKWHLAHTTWFFETFVLERVIADYRPFHPAYGYLFNSYYNAVGAQFPRPRRGVLSRPTVAETRRYREAIDEQMLAWLDSDRVAEWERIGRIVELGLHHEQQHQELLLTDIKHVFSCNPLRPAYAEEAEEASGEAPPLRWQTWDAGLRWIGHEGGGFAYDNESPRHRVFVNAFALASRAVTSGEYLAFMEDGGYERPELWLSDGWATVQQRGWRAPLYWEKHDGQWWHMTLGGFRPVDPAAPVCHVSYFEADAYARWAGARLPTEAEWETVASSVPLEGTFLDSRAYHPRPASGGGSLEQVFGDVWEWTASPYVAYPGYRPAAGALGEYNAKFMCNQMVLRGGSCLTPTGHIRATYRNFFPPDARWQCTGIRLARDL